jgi:hypothetical protein
MEKEQETIDLSPEQKISPKDDILEALFNNFIGTITWRATAPAYTPKTFKEQFYLFDDGDDKKLYVYIDGWVSITLT